MHIVAQHAIVANGVSMRFLLCLQVLSAVALTSGTGSAQGTAVADSFPHQTFLVDAASSSTPFPHFWEQMFGSGRAVLSMRESYRDDIRDVKKIVDFDYVRFHAIFHDELGVYDEDANGNPVYNFSYIDQIYDGLLKNGVRPMVELGFMPKKLASNPEALHPFWYHQNTSPPKDYAKWDAFIQAFVGHLVDRYGIDEVSRWYFEVWNEPNLDFWTGNPKQPTYFELYDHTARDVKAVSSRLRVGGPATAQAAWVGDLIAHAQSAHVPLDFASTHIYGDAEARKVFGPDFKGSISRDEMACKAISKVHTEILHSALPNLPLYVTEFNAGFKQYQSRDTLYVGTFLANTIRQCDGMVQMMSFWTFSDVFEEQGPVKTPMHGSFGLMGAGGFMKPSYVAFELLHKLGDTRLNIDADDVIVTRHKDGQLTLALWNLVDPEPGPGQPPVAVFPQVKKTVTLRFAHLKARRVEMLRLDENHSDSLVAYRKMGSPQYPTRAQIQQLRTAARLTTPEHSGEERQHLPDPVAKRTRHLGHSLSSL